MSQKKYIRVVCFSCGSKMRSPKELAGMVIKCGSCSEYLKITDDGEKTFKSSQAEYDAERKERVRVYKKRDAKKRRGILYRFFSILLFLGLLGLGGYFFYKRVGQDSYEVESTKSQNRFKTGREVVEAFLNSTSPAEVVEYSKKGKHVMPFLKQLKKWDIPIKQPYYRILDLYEKQSQTGKSLSYTVRLNKDAILNSENFAREIIVQNSDNWGFRVDAVGWYMSRYNLLNKFEEGELGEEAIFPLVVRKRSLLKSDEILLKGKEGIGLSIIDIWKNNIVYEALSYKKGEAGDIIDRYVTREQPRILGCKIKRVEANGIVKLLILDVLE